MSALEAVELARGILALVDDAAATAGRVGDEDWNAAMRFLENVGLGLVGHKRDGVEALRSALGKVRGGAIAGLPRRDDDDDDDLPAF